MTEPLADHTFYAFAIVWFLLVAISPRRVILILSFGRSRISDTGEKVLRCMGALFALVALVNLARS